MNVPPAVQGKFDKLEVQLKAMRLHPLFTSLKTIEDLRIFMDYHIFAVWDFMTLAKRLQREFTTVTLPWMPPTDMDAAKLVNGIVMGEETDELPNGKVVSHFEMYLMAMKDVGAEGAKFNKFFDQLVPTSFNVDLCLGEAEVDPAIRKFVNGTMKCAIDGTCAQVLGSFFYGREDSIPEMFDHLLKSWDLKQDDAPTFVYYLKRHIDLDGDEHAPAVERIIKQKLGSDEAKWNELVDSAIEAVELRIQLWDALEVAIKNNQKA